MEIRLLDVAQQELDEAVDYYNAESPGLGDLFLLEAVAVFKGSNNFPKLGIRILRTRGVVRRAGFPTA